MISKERDIERLVREWREHGKIVLAVDFDDTIFHWKHNSAEDCREVASLVRWVKTIGAYIMIHTASDPDRHEEIKQHCLDMGFGADSINRNPIDLPYGETGKPYYNWQLCDRSGLPYAIEVLEEAAKQMIDYKRSNLKLDDVG